MAPDHLLMRLLWWVGAVVIDLCESAVLLYQVVWQARPDPRPAYRLARAGGHCMLAAALSLWAARHGWETGIALWLGLVLAATLVVALTLRLPRRWLSVTASALVLGLSGIASLLAR